MSIKKNEKTNDFFADVETDLKDLEQSDAVRQSKDLSNQLAVSRHRLDKLEMLTEITQSMNSTLNLTELLSDIVDSTIKLADMDRGFLMLNNRAGELKFRIARDSRQQNLGESDFEVSHTIIGEAADKGKPLFISDVDKNGRYKDQKSVLDLQLKTAVCLPLIRDDAVIGVIYTDASRLSIEIDEEDMPIFSAFAVQAAIAIENARLHGELILSKENLTRENLELKAVLSEKYEFSGIIGKSKPMMEIFSTIRKISPFDTTVMITGATGTGKELIARAIHFNGPRKTNQLVTINCGAMSPELLESELFGHKKGSFTGATSDKPGLFETASGGTLFLDEIGDMPLPLQVKLLRALQEGEIRRVGENTVRNVDVRVIAATNRDLSEDIKAGSFRQDLFYRLNVVPVSIPPLNERQEDILPLTLHFLEKYSSKMDKGETRIEPNAMKILLTNPWPGNVRELENTVERALALCGDSTTLSIAHFPQLNSGSALTGSADAGGALKPRMRVVEKQFIEEALAETGGKITKAAEILDVTRQHLHNKIKQYGLNNHKKK
ncbi:MAG: sigma 54-interacting transcriptional regulator [Candidatus Krumholzibacteria bacterium]|nr:sigma 54-interacting transcriptional regulator [Candidatus Krumholzibacteria bacterium]